jgi:hypothetical protein
VALLSTGDASAQQYAAKALEWLARDCVENQIALANERASAPLVGLLGSESLETQASAVTALLCLASHPESRDTVVQRLVAVLEGRDTAIVAIVLAVFIDLAGLVMGTGLHHHPGPDLPDRVYGWRLWQRRLNRALRDPLP